MMGKGWGSVWRSTGMLQAVLILSTAPITHVSSFLHLGEVVSRSSILGWNVRTVARLRGGPISDVASCQRQQWKTTTMQLDPNLLATSAALHLASSVSVDDAARYFLAGGICCSISHGWTVPIDVVKTRIQCDDSLKNFSPVQAGKAIVEKNGVGGLFLGFGSTLVGYTTAGSVKYGLYEVFKPIAYDGCTAEIIASAVLYYPPQAVPERVSRRAVGPLFPYAQQKQCPREDASVTEPSYGNEVFDAFPKLLRERGLKSIYSSLPTMYTKMLPGTMFQLASYELFAIQAYKLLQISGFQTDGTSRFVISTTCALLASVVSTVASHPGDCLLSEISKAGAKDKPAWEVLRGMGPAELTAGFGPRLIHVITLVTTQLVFYDYAKVLVGLSFTGSK